MTDVNIVGVSFAYPQQSALLVDINLCFSTGWTGVLGGNGSGKSTLLKLLDGNLKPDTGTIHNSGRHVTYQYQALLSSDALVSFAWEWSKESLRWLSALGNAFGRGEAAVAIGHGISICKGHSDP